MLVQGQIVKKRWENANKKWYINKGYTFTKIKDDFCVKVEDLTENSKDKVSVVCDYCGATYTTEYSVYLKGFSNNKKNACKHCSGKKTQLINANKRAEERYKKALKICEDNNFTLVSPKNYFYNVKYYIYYICPFHGLKKSIVDNFLRGHYCKECSSKGVGDILRTNSISVKNDIERTGEFILLNSNDYSDANKNNLLIKHKACGEISNISYSNFRKAKCGCKYCASKVNGLMRRLNPDDVERIVNEKNNNILLNKEEYLKNNLCNLKIKCGRCGNIYSTSLSSYNEGKIMCDECSKWQSKGETTIKNILLAKNVSFLQQYCFDNCRNKRPLPFDFYLPEYNICIEYQGKQHYESIEYFGGDETFKLQQKRDQIKRDFCKNNSIKLYEIPYWEFNNVEQLLAEYLKL